MNQKVDVVIIGSGAAGSVMAYELSKRGLKVMVLERGARNEPQTFMHDELTMLPRVYKHGGLQMSEDHDVSIVQGSTLGGSTVINNAIWLRANLDRILPEWEKRSAFVSKPALENAYKEIETVLQVSPIIPGLANRGSNFFLRGCEQLGIPADYLSHNRNNCIACGWCNYGCKYNRKTSMLVTYIHWAESRGAVFFDRCQNVAIKTTGHLAHSVSFIRDREEITIKADRIVVCAGAIGSSALLLQSGINPNGLVGQGFHVLGGAFVTAETKETIDGFDGIGLTCVAHASEEYVIESFFAPPVVFSLSLGGWFLSHFNRMLRYRNFIDGGVMVGSDPAGRIWLDKKKNVHIGLTFSNNDLDRLRRGIKTLARIYFAAGALKVFPATFKLMEFFHPDDLDLIDDFVRKPDDLLLGSAHPQGGNPISENPAGGVVNNNFQVHGYNNLYVADASVFPSNIRTNCQATVMAISHYAAGFVAS